MSPAVFVLLLYLLDIVKLQDGCVRCSEDVTTNCFATCDERINIALQGTVYQLPVTETVDSTLDTVKFEGTSFITLSSNPRTGLLYLSTEDTIYSHDPSATNGSLFRPLTEHSIHHPTGLDIDVTTGNIYWADHTLASIFVADSSGENKTTLVVLSAEERPFDLVVDSERGIMIWSEPYKGTVRIAALDGTDVSVVARNLTFPTGIAFDPVNNNLMVMTLGAESMLPDTIVQLAHICRASDLEDCVSNKIVIPDREGSVQPGTRFAYLAMLPGGIILSPVVHMSSPSNGLSLTKIESSGRITTERMQWGSDLEVDDIPSVSVTTYRNVTSQENLCQNASCQYLCVVCPLHHGPAPVCLCQDGYHLNTDNQTCTKGTQTILYTDQLNIVTVDLDSRSEAVLDFGDDLMQVGVGIDYDQLTKTVYWSDIRFSQIVKVEVGGTPVVVGSNVGHPSGLSIDWITKYIYYVDDDSNTLNILTNDGSDRATLATFGDSPRSVKVDPLNGFVFWTDRGDSPMIIRAKLSGSNVTVIALLTEPGSYPNGVALDIPNKMVYWIDAGTDQIMGRGYEDDIAKSVIFLSASQGFSLAVLDGFFYWSDWQQKRIGRVRMDNSTEPETVVTAFGVIMEIVAYSETFSLGTTNACTASPCSHFCFNTGDVDQPYTCGCPEGVPLDPQNPNSCEKSPCEINNGDCAQNCALNDERQAVCGCFDFYELYDGKCVESFLLLATKHKIWKVSALGDSAHQQTPVTVQGKVVALDFDSKNGRIFWTDTLIDAIFVANISSNSSSMVIGDTLQTPDGIAYDWVTDAVYWTDMGTKIIGATKSDGSYSRTVVSFEETDKPRAIVLDPKRGKMYYTDWGSNSGIFSAWLDGANVTKILSGNISWPNGLTIDRENQVLYWVDAKMDVLERVDIVTNVRKTLTSFTLAHSFALTIYINRAGNADQNKILITDWKDKAILEVMLSNTTTYRQYSDESQVFAQGQPFDIQWYSASLQTDTNDCTVNNGNCSHFCFYTPEGVRCGCPQNIQLEENGQQCVKDPCSSDNGGCQQTCIVSEQGNVTCTCKDWFKSDPTNSSACIESELSMFVLERNALLEVAVDTEPLYRKTVSIQPAISSGISLDIDFRARRLYWSDSLHDSISSANFDGSDVRTIVSGLQVPDGIAVDWLAGNIYWTDTGPDQIFVARSSDGSNTVPLKITGLDRPRAILVCPADSYLFWTDWGTSATVGKAAMDGSGQVALVTTGLGWPNGLAFDEYTKTLYWVDALEDKIESVASDGQNRRVVYEENIQHPYGFHYFADHLYWTDWTSQSIKRIHKEGSNFTSLMSFGTALMDITFQSPDHQMPGPCYREGEPVPDYDILHNTLYIGFKGPVASINLTISYDGTDKYLQLHISARSMQLFDLGANEPKNEVVFPSDLYPPDGGDYVHDYVKYFYITHGVCYTRHGGKYLAGYTTGTRRGYRNLDSAKQACQKYPDCGGITYERDNGKLYKFTLRAGSLPLTSPSNEISWLQADCGNGQSETLTIGKGKVSGEDVLMVVTEALAHTITHAEVLTKPDSRTWLCPGYLSPCGVDKGSCLGLCLVNPGGRTCACDGDLDPMGVKCLKHKRLLLAATNDLLMFELGGDFDTANSNVSVVKDESLIASIDFIYTHDTDHKLSQILPNDQDCGMRLEEADIQAVEAITTQGLLDAETGIQILQSDVSDALIANYIPDLQVSDLRRQYIRVRSLLIQQRRTVPG